MSAPSDNQISFGKLHRALRDLPVMVRDYNTLVVEIAVLPRHTLLQPWPLLQQDCETDIPITIGKGATEFNWDVATPTAYFLKRGDFIQGCQPVAPPTITEVDPRLRGAVGCWKVTGGGFLLQGTPTPWPPSAPSSVRLFTGQTVHSASEFYLVDPLGHITHTYSVPRLYGNDETLYIADIYAVVRGHLCCFLWQQAWPNDSPGATVEVILQAVVDCSPSELPFEI